MGGHVIRPEKELATISNLLNDAEDKLNNLLAKARDCKFISEIKYDPGTSKLFVTECRLPEKLDALPFAYRKIKREFVIPRGTNGKSIKNISCANSVNENKVTITVAYDKGVSDVATFKVKGCKGPKGPKGADGTDYHQKPDDAYRHPGAKFISGSNGQTKAIASAAGRTRSLTGVSASVTGAAVGVTGLSVSVNLSYTSIDAVFTSLCGFKVNVQGPGADMKIGKFLLYALGMLVCPVNVVFGICRTRAGVLKRAEKAVTTTTAFQVKN